jgi:hypothetical protein
MPIPIHRTPFRLANLSRPGARANRVFASACAQSLIPILLATFPSPLGAAERAEMVDAARSALRWEGRTEGAVRIRLSGGNGAARIRAVDGDRIVIHLRLERNGWTDDESWRRALSWFTTSRFDDDEALARAVEIDVERRGSELVVSPLPHGRSRESRLAELWELEVPRALAVEIAMKSAVVEVVGVAGGVELSLGHGRAEVDVPGGPLDLEVTVGELEVRTAQGDFGRLSLASKVGETRLWLHGNRVRYPKPPGPGSRIEIDGDGANDLRLRVEVGDAALHVQ